MSLKKQVTHTLYDLMIEIRRLTRTTLMHQHLIAQRMGLNVTDAECIDFLQEMGPSTAGALAKATHLTTGAMTNVIDRLEKAGFVKRSADPADRRKVMVSLIPERRQETRKLYTALANDVQQLFSKYDQDQLDFLVEHTKTLIEIYQQQVIKIDKT